MSSGLGEQSANMCRDDQSHEQVASPMTTYVAQAKKSRIPSDHNMRKCYGLVGVKLDHEGNKEAANQTSCEHCGL